MQLMTKELRRTFARVGSQDGAGDDARILAHFFNPTGVGDWYATEYDPDADGGGGMFFGYVNFGDPINAELGYFSARELGAARLSVRVEIHSELFESPRILGIERDRHWDDTKTVGDIRKEIGAVTY